MMFRITHFYFDKGYDTCIVGLFSEIDYVQKADEKDGKDH